MKPLAPAIADVFGGRILHHGLGLSEAPDKRANQTSEVRGLDLSGNATNRELAGLRGQIAGD